MGCNITINKMIENLSEIDYTHIYSKRKMIIKNTFYPAESVYKEYIEKYKIYKYVKK
jgi:hypothetical protein